MKTLSLLDISMTVSRYQDFLELLEHPEKKTLVFTPNPEIFVRASKDVEFNTILQKATYNVPDGVGLYLGYELSKGKSAFTAWLNFLFHRSELVGKYGDLIKGSDLTRDVLESGKEKSKRILIIDRKNAVPKNDFEFRKAEIQKNLKSLIESKYPGILVYVVFSGEQTSEEIAKLIEKESIEYVFSCIGMKSQEKLLIEIFDFLPENQKVVGLGVGASIDFLMGIQKRAPIIFQKFGLEWLYRLITQPRIRAKRIYDAVVGFPRLVKNTQDS